MLTNSEREWLETRDKKRPYCFYCEALFGTDSCYWKCVTESCAMYPDMKDAAEFSERVAAKLANPQWAVCWNSDSCLEFGGSKDEPRWVWDCEWCRLKHAHLQVEEDMDAEMDK